MRSKEETSRDVPEENERWLPPPVPGGIEYVESLGRWIDNLFGDARIHRRVEAKLRPHYLREDEMPEDPPPEEAPPPVIA